MNVILRESDGCKKERERDEEREKAREINIRMN